MSYLDIVSADSPNYYFRFEGTNVTNSGSVTTTVDNGSSNTFASGGVAGDRIYSANKTGSAYGFKHSDSASIFNDKIFTIEGWIKIASNDDLEGGNLFNDEFGSHIFAAGTVGTYNQNNLATNVRFGFYKGATSSTPQIFSSVGGNGAEYTFSSFVWNQWHHVALVADGSTQKIYFNGAEVASANVGSTTPTADGNTKYWIKERPSQYTNLKGWIGYADELAAYSTALSQSRIQARVDYITGATIAAAPSTASALAVQPALSVSSVHTAVPATASALAGDTRVSNFNTPTMLDGYLAGRSLEQWYKFDELNKINNYGSGGNAASAWAFTNTSIEPQNGRQGSGALKLKGEAGAKVQLAFAVSEPYSTEITDNEFSIGLWFKAESGYQDKTPNIVVLNAAFSPENYVLKITTAGYVQFTVTRPNGTSETVTKSTNICDNDWHLIQVRASDTNNLIAVSIDNGTEVTATVNGTFPTVNNMFFGDAATSGSNNKYAYISHYWVTGYSSIGSTERAAIITAAAVPIQGTAGMVEPRLKFTNVYQDLVDSYSPKISFRLDEASGTPTNFGSSGTFSVGKIGTNLTYRQPTQNTCAYKFTNADTYIQGDYGYSSGTFSTGNHQTMIAVFKSESTVNFEQIIGSMGMYGFIGSGITFTIAGSSGYLEAKINQGFGGTDTDSLTTTINVADNKYHLVVGIRDGGDFKLYLDGKQVATKSSCTTTLSDSGAYGISAEAKFNFGQGAASKVLHIDEFAVLSTSLSATEVFALHQALGNASEWTASATAVQPTVQTGSGPMISSAVFAASALSPFFIAPSIYAATATTLFQQPNFAATKNTNNAASPMTASAQGENPGFDIGENQSVLHMDASAAMGDAKAFIPGFWNANPMIANATMVQPAIALTKGALIKPQSLNANAFFSLPPAYYLVSDDKWYQRLLLVDYDSSNFNGNTAFFNTSSDIVRGGGFGGWNAIDQRNVFNDNYGYNLNDLPLPVAYAGTYDPQNRKALRIRNIALIVADGFANTGANWTFETYIKTTKKNQMLFVGKQLGDTSNAQSQDFNTAWRLRDGKISLNNTKSLISGFPNSNDAASFTGFKDIADGEWHHIIIQNRNSDRRTQVFIDGELDIQRYGYDAYAIHQVGFNSSDANAYSDFETSAISLNRGSFVLERETFLNYLAAIGVTPIEAPVATASAVLTQNTKARGNRGRALMLYFWDTYTPDRNDYQPFSRGLGTSGTLNDQGSPGSDPDSFYSLNTWINNAPNKFYDWDIWPCPVVRFPAGESYNGDSHPILKDGITKSGTSRGTVYVDPITDNYRYLDVMNDLKDLDQFDMICFRNYPDDSSERDAFGTSAKGVADEYFNTLDKYLFEDFLKSLRDAVDTGISLFITNPQLAIDLGFIEDYAQISDLADPNDNINSPKIATDPLNTGLFSPLNYVNSTTDPSRNNKWSDMAKNNRHKIVNEIEDLTTDDGYVWDKVLQYTADGLEYGQTGRVFHHIEYKPKLSVNDTFLISDFRTSGSTYFAVPFNKVKAGKIVTSFADTYLQGTTETVNPYRNYATTIAVEPGTVVAGKQIGAKVFISFTDGVGNQKSVGGYGPFENIQPINGALIELKTDAFIDYAYSLGSISIGERTEYKANPNNLDRQLAAGKINQATYNAKAYWQLDGQNLLGQADAYGGSGEDLVDTADGVTKRKVSGRTRAGKRNTITSTSSLPSYTIKFSYLYPLASIETPSINTRGLWWLSERLAYETLPQRPVSMDGSAFMPTPVVTGYKVATIGAQAMIATATLSETNYKSGSVLIGVLPMTATVGFVNIGNTLMASAMTANAVIGLESRTFLSEGDQVVLYIMHEDPILYIREDVIK